jgi:hypothetical protein
MKKRSTVAVFVMLLLSSSLTRADPPTPAWVGRFESALKKMLQGSNSSVQIATAIQKITHPSGSRPLLIAYQTSSHGPEVRDPPDAYTVQATMTVAWSGALGGSRTVSVLWEMGRHEHYGANVESDDAPIPVSKGQAAKLNDYFRRLYPSVELLAGEAGPQEAPRKSAPLPRVPSSMP